MIENRTISREVYTTKIKQLLKANHYTQAAPSAVKYCFVLRDVEQNVKGVILYSHFSRLQANRKYENYLELSRMWLVEGEPKNTASFFIGHTLRFLQNKTSLAGVISYADPTVGHTGSVYKASNFTLLGKTGTSYHYEDNNGLRLHKKKIWRDAKNIGITEVTHAMELGIKKIPETEKLIFQYVFKRKSHERGSIYKVVLPGGKCYIGQTVNALDSRLRRHVLDAKNGSNLIFHKALRQYDYQCDITLLELVPITDLANREQYWITYYESTKRDKGYNDPTAPLGILDRTPEHVLFVFFEMRSSGLSYQEIGATFGLSSGYVNSVINGRSRPEILAKWLETNVPLEKYKTVDDSTVLKCFALHDSGKSLADVAREVDVTKTYVSYIFQGTMRSALKERYEKETGKPFVFRNTKTVNRDLAKKILEEKHAEGITAIALAERHGLTVDQVRDIVTGTTAKEVYEEFTKNNKVTKNFKYSDAKLLSAFALRFKDGLSAKEVAVQLGIDRSFLSLLFNGKNRKDLKEQWELEHGSLPTLSEIKAQAARRRHVTV